MVRSGSQVERVSLVAGVAAGLAMMLAAPRIASAQPDPEGGGEVTPDSDDDANSGGEGAVPKGSRAPGAAPADDVQASPPPPPAEAALEVSTGSTAAALAVGRSGLTLPAGSLVIEGSTVNVNLSADKVGKPVSFAPSIRYGVTSKLTLAVVHDGGSMWLTPRPAPGAGICVTGDEHGCPQRYNNLGLDGLYDLVAGAGPFGAAAHVGIDLASLDPAIASLRIGMLGRFRAGNGLSIVADPRIGIGLNRREDVTSTMGAMASPGNREYVDVPVWVWYRAAPTLGVYAQTGLRAPFDHFQNSIKVPVGVGVAYQASTALALGVDFWFPNLLGSSHSADARSIGLRISYTLN